jgi:hypothetical protein
MFLVRLIEALVDEWGAEQVETTVYDVVAGGKVRRRESRTALLPRSAKSGVQRKPNAAEQVGRLQVDGPRRNVLLEIAAQFDRKQFLPSVADVREFLILSGGHPSGIKDRTEGFRTLLQMLVEVPDERLQSVLEAAKHAGPSQLGPISDAISNAGQRMASRHEPPPGRGSEPASDRSGADNEEGSARKADAAGR